MCCKLPPFPTGIVAIYLFLNSLLFAVEHTKGLYMVGPTQIHIQSITKCSNYEEKDLILDYSIDDEDMSVTANMTLDFDFDETVKVNFREKPFLPKQPLVIFINQRSFCKVADTYLFERPYPMPSFSFENVRHTLCPILKGGYYVRGLKINFALLEVPYEMFGFKRYQLELVKDGNMLMCLELQINTTSKALIEYGEYGDWYKSA